MLAVRMTFLIRLRETHGTTVTVSIDFKMREPRRATHQNLGGAVAGTLIHIFSLSSSTLTSTTPQHN